MTGDCHVRFGGRTGETHQEQSWQGARSHPTLIAIHRWGWTLTLNPDTTTTATSPDGTRTLHSHGPPAEAA